MSEREISNKLKATIFEFLETPDNEKRQFVERNQGIILNPLTDSFLLELAAEASYSEEAKINTYRKVLLDCNHRNIATAFTEHEKLINHITQAIHNFMTTPHLDEKKKILKDNLDILTSLGIYALNIIVTEAERNALLAGASKSAKAQKVIQNELLIIKCTEFGVDFPFWEIENNYDDYWVSQMEYFGNEEKEGNQMTDFYALIKSLVEQTEGLVIRETRPEGFLVTKVLEPLLMKVYLSPATSDLAYFAIPSSWLQFESKREIPNWLSSYVEGRTKDFIAKWSLQESEDGIIYVLEHFAKINNLSPIIFSDICDKMMKENLSFSVWANSTTRKQNCKSLTDINPKLANLNL